MSRAIALSGVLASLAFGACSGDTLPVFSDGGVMDAPEAEVAVRVYTDVNHPEARGRMCERSAQCDDGVACTMDYCASDGRCANVPDTSRCDDNVWCNGQEVCDARRGCVRGAPVTCDDNDGCTTDRCDETTRGCAHEPRDFDHDGDPDIACQSASCADAGVPDGGAIAGASCVDEVALQRAGQCWMGRDCDDRDPHVSGCLPEICGDGIDNNCNGLVDAAEPGGCQRAPYDRCDTPLDVSAGGRFNVSLAGTVGDYPFRCGGGMLARDVVLRLHLDAPRDVAISAQSASGFSLVYLEVEDVCGTSDAAQTRICTLGFPSLWRTHSLPAGDHFILLGGNAGSTGTEATARVDVTLTDPTPVAPNDTCAAPTEIPAGGGTFHGDLIGATDDVSTQCGGASPDALYRLTLTDTRDVSVTLVGSGTDSVTASLVDACTRSPHTVRCIAGATASFVAHQVPAGTYYVVVEGSATPAYTLTVATPAPTPPPAGDTCATALPLTPGTVSGSLASFGSDQPVTCNPGSARDAVYRFTTTTTQDVTVTATGGASDYFYVAVASTCGDLSTERGCRAGAPGRVTLRGLDPGTYYVIVRSSSASTYTLQLDTRDSVAPTAVTGNDTCATAQAVPSGGGFFSGDSTPLMHDYAPPCVSGTMAPDAVFRYHLAARSRVLFSTEGSAFDTVLWVTQADMCPGSPIAGATTPTCNDDAVGVTSAVTITLDPGDYYAYVSGFSTGSRGAYYLAVTPSAP